MSRLERLLWLAGCLLLVACGESGTERWGGTADTLPSGAVLVSSPEEGLWEPGEAWRLVENLRIGSAEGRGPEVFARIRGLEVDPRGRIYVLEGDAAEIRVFGPDGGYLRTIGGTGTAPGKLRRPSGLDWVEGEGLWVPDIGNARFTLFDAQGRYVRSLPRQAAGASFTWRGAVTRDGFVDSGFVQRGGNAVPALFPLDPGGLASDTVLLPLFEPETFSLEGDDFARKVTVPFSPELVWRYHPNGYIWFGIPDRYRLVQRTLRGDTLRIVERAYEPVPVTPEERVEREEELGGYDLDLRRIPGVKPAFDAIFWDDASRLWVRATAIPAEEGRPLDVFDLEGRYLGRVESPVPILATPPPIIGDTALWAVTRDEREVEYVVRLGIRKGPVAQ